jgi:exonuclease SbcD
MKLLHFADAHIDMANYGRHDPETGLPLRVLDFLKSLDKIVETAINEKVDLVIFAGDAYKDRSPAPTFQREWGKRIIRLSQAKIPTILLIGNHDLSPAIGRAHAVQEFDTLQIPFVRVIAAPALLTPDDLFGAPVQVIGFPYIARSGLIAALNISGLSTEKVYEEIEDHMNALMEGFVEKSDPSLPLILAAHGSVQGAIYGGERMVMLGSDLVLSGSFVRNPKLDYAALGHIHKPQDLNEGSHPPVIYPGSIERVDFGEIDDKKYFVIADVQKGKTDVEWRELKNIRRMIDCYATIDSDEGITQKLISALPSPKQINGAIIRLVIDYPRMYEALIDEAALRQAAASAFEFNIVKKPQMDIRARLPQDAPISSLSPDALFDLYLKSLHADEVEAQALRDLAAQIFTQEDRES